MRASSLLQGKFRSAPRRIDSEDSEKLRPSELKSKTSPEAALSARNSSSTGSPGAESDYDDFVIGLISGRPEYWHSSYRSMLQGRKGIIIDVPGECPCGFRAGLMTLREVYPFATWYYIGDEDVFINMKQLGRFLKKLDPTVPTVAALPGFKINASHTTRTVCKRSHPAGVKTNGTVLYGGSGHIVNAAMMDAVDYSKACTGRHPMADYEHSCFLFAKWKSHFHFEPFRNINLIEFIDDPDKLPQTLESFESAMVTHKVSPRQQDLLEEINAVSSSSQGENASAGSGTALGRAGPTVLRSYDNLDCDSSDRQCPHKQQPTCRFDALAENSSDYNVTFLLRLTDSTGTTAGKELTEYHLPEKEVFLTDSICQGAVPQRAQTITFLTDPRSDIYSQYKQCQAKQQELNTQAEPVSQTLSQWLQQNTSSSGKALIVDCDVQANTQTRLLSCDSSVLAASYKHGDVDEKDLKKAIHRISKKSEVKFVGVMDLYQESMCLVHVRSKGVFPSYCDCQGPNWAEFPTKKGGDGLLIEPEKLEQETALGPAELKLIDNITAFDRQLYDAARERLIHDIREVELLYGKTIYCADT